MLAEPDAEPGLEDAVLDKAARVLRGITMSGYRSTIRENDASLSMVLKRHAIFSNCL
jgi:hypothetical protein